MNATRMMMVAVLVGMTGGCANLEHSRDVADPRVSGSTLAVQVCANCHGVTGNSISPNFPNLAAQQQPYLVAQLTQFKSHSRMDPAGPEYMWGLSHNLGDRQIQELATYFSGQHLERRPVEGKPARIAAGKTVFTDGLPAQSIPACSSCHGADGMGNAAFPRIAGQHVDYIEKQLLVFQRTNQRPQGVVMKTVAHQLTRQNIADVAAYLQSKTNR